MTQEKTSRPDKPVYHVLFVDDEEVVRRTMKDSLEQDNAMRVTTVTSALEAQKLLESTQFGFDAILADLSMPEVSGEDLLEWVRMMSPEIPVIILSGYRTDDTLMRCLEKGANDFLDKPCKPKKIRETLEQAIRASKRGKTMVLNDGIHAEYPAADWVELTAPSEMEYLARMNRFSDLLFSSRLPQDICEDFKLAIEELGRNAIEWGNRFNHEKKVRISYCIFSDRVVLKVEDEGEGFQPNFDYDPSKDPLGHLNSRKEAGKRPGGYGVFLLRNMMDEVQYNERGNVCLMTKLIPQDNT